MGVVTLLTPTPHVTPEVFPTIHILPDLECASDGVAVTLICEGGRAEDVTSWEFEGPCDGARLDVAAENTARVTFGSSSSPAQVKCTVQCTLMQAMTGSEYRTSILLSPCALCGSSGLDHGMCGEGSVPCAHKDKCGVCGGDGTSCTTCTETKVAEVEGLIDSASYEQQKLVTVVARHVARQAKRAGRLPKASPILEQLTQEAASLHQSTWTLSWGGLHLTSRTCDAEPAITSCSRRSNEEATTVLRKNSLDLKLLADRLGARLKQFGASARTVKRYSKRSKALYARAIRIISQVPNGVDECRLSV